MKTDLKKPADGHLQSVTLAGREIPLRIRRNKRARRIILRVDPDTGGALVTLPYRASVREATALVTEKGDWLLDRLAELPPHILFRDGAVIPYLGEDHAIRRNSELAGVVQRGSGVLHVSGAPEHLSRRLADWLKGQAKAEITHRARSMAEQIDGRINRITVRDTKSRWGSCSPAGNLNFCWRLIMAPPWVMDYVTAHEVAHLRHLDHSKNFWRTVDNLGVQTKPARRWLNDNGSRLQRIG